MQFLVLGMHRSGTSALARVLGLMGCHAGTPDELAPGDDSNPKGYWERKDVWALDERMLALTGASWQDVGAFDTAAFDADARAAFAADAGAILARLDARGAWVVKDPRLCLLLPLWRPLLTRPVCVLIHRDPLEVARSLQKRDGFPLAAGVALWERYLGDALRHSAGLPRVLVSYERLIAQPLDAVHELLAGLLRAGVGEGTLKAPPAPALTAFLDPSLHHQRTRSGQADEFLNAEQRELRARVARPSALDEGPPAPLSAAAKDALDSLARQDRRYQEHVRLLESMIADKDRYVTALLDDRERSARARAEQAAAEQTRAERQQAEAEERRRAEAAAAAAAAEAAARDWSAYAVCTIVSRNYLSLARACCRSFLEHHPGARAFVLLVDTLSGFDPAQEPFECLPADGIGIADFADFAFKYSILELNTAVKPAFLEYLFAHRGVANVFYLDPDIYVYGPLTEARRALEAGQVVLTPHLLRPIPRDGRKPQEQDILGSGTYNLGFLGLKRTEETLDLLHWWHERLYDGAFSDPARGLFTDQKWMNLVPGLFSGVSVLRDAGYNVAYWNLHERGDLAPAPEGGYRVRGEPLRFFHFSGYDKRHAARVSKHQDRFRVPDLNRHYRDLFGAYGQALDAFGWAETRLLPYAYGRFDNGAAIADLMRRAYFALGEERHRFGDPFRTAGEGSLFTWLTRPHRPGAPLSPLLLQMRECRGDLKDAFPEPEGRDLLAYMNWVLEHHSSDFGLGSPYDSHFRAVHAAALEADRAARTEAPVLGPAAVPVVEPEEAPKVEPEGPPRSAWKRGIATLVGDEAYRRFRREWIWPFYRRMGWRFEHSTPRVEQLPEEPRPFGVNLFGYLDTESGVGETGRGFAEILRVSGLPHALLNIEQPWLRRGDRSVRGFARAAPYAVNLLVVNADQFPHVYQQAGLRRGGAYDIGFWAWELPQFPRATHAAALQLVDEIWTHSEFCRSAFAQAASVPVVKIVPALSVQATGRHGRADFGFDDAFTFLYVFDAASIVKRKNPGGAISAFRRAFDPDEPVRLVLKTTNATPRQVAALERLAGNARVSVRNGYFARAQLLDLLAACDAYVSLHRSEGLGLTLLETLMLNKPVLATRYSGVTEFLEGPGTYPVGFREVQLRRAYGPYPKGSVWADPDAADAARRMRELYEDWRPGGRAHGAEHGAAVRLRYSAATLAPALVARLNEIRKRVT